MHLGQHGLGETVHGTQAVSTSRAKRHRRKGLEHVQAAPCPNIHPCIHASIHGRPPCGSRRAAYVPTLAPSVSAPDAVKSPETAVGAARPLPMDWQEGQKKNKAALRRTVEEEAGDGDRRDRVHGSLSRNAVTSCASSLRAPENKRQRGRTGSFTLSLGTEAGSSLIRFLRCSYRETTTSTFEKHFVCAPLSLFCLFPRMGAASLSCFGLVLSLFC